MSAQTTIKDISNNVVVFPKAKDGIPPQSLEELKKRIVLSRMEVAEALAEEMTKENVRIMMDNGYYISNTKDIAFLMVTIKSILLRHEDIFYPVQKLIDENISIGDTIIDTDI